MKRYIRLTYILALLLTVNNILIAQETIPKNEENKLALPDIEKIYLHTDRSYYTVGESLWYKAYVVYAYNNLLFDNSNLLHVELVSSKQKIVARTITKLEAGLGYGDFKLKDSIGITAGKYQLRAYTNWMRNFGDDFMFKKEIEILDVNATRNKETAVIPDAKNKQENTIKESENTFTVQFFPEGGSLVENVRSFVAFKAADIYGNPIEIKGAVLDAEHKTVALLKSRHNGMGKFVFTPQKGKKYTAVLDAENGEKLEVEIPKVDAQGYVLSANFVDGKHIVSIRTNKETLQQNNQASLTVLGTSKGVTYFEGVQTLTSKNLSFLIPTDLLPEGISQITLYNQNAIPCSERLVYIEKNHAINITITPNKTQFAPKEKITLKISAQNTDKTPLVASFSLTAIDKNGTKKGTDNSMNIASYFLLESDIKGKVHNSGYYFNSENSKRLYHLDLLLLTQGWRDFLWKRLPVLNDSIEYKKEKGITIAGTVTQVLGSSPKENSQVRLILMNQGKSLMLNDTTDAAGKFKFENLVFTGASTMMLNTQNEKGKNRGMFLLDSLYNSPPAIDFKADNTLPSLKQQTINQHIFKKYVNFNIPIDNMLNEVLITATKKEEQQSKYGVADRTYIPKEEGPSFSNIYQLIQYAIPGVLISGNSVSFSRGKGPALILIDGVVAEMTDLEFISPDDVAKIESLTSSRAAIFGSQGANGAILIYIKEGAIGLKKKAFHSIVQEIQGFYDARVFYAPDYDEINEEFEQIADIRNTLYWNPFVHPDAKGVSEISYFNSEVNTEVKVTLEGVTSTGIPIVVKTYYTIETIE